MASAFFRSEIQATDSTFTGWTAKIAAASHTPGRPKRRSTRQTNITLAACSNRFTQ